MNQPALKEKEITYQIRSLLKQFGYYHWKVFQTLGSTPGVSDIIGVEPKTGKIICIEVKTAKGQLSEFQSRFLQAVNDAGGIAFVARDLETVIEKLDLKKGMLF
jgi:hypothetical protein